MFKKVNRKEKRRIRHLRLRKKVIGTADRPRLAVCKSLNHIYAQVIDDVKGCTLVASSSVEPKIKAKLGRKGGSIEGAKVIGREIAERAIKKGIKKVVFDRGGNLYHGRIAALAEAAREAGLEF